MSLTAFGSAGSSTSTAQSRATAIRFADYLSSRQFDLFPSLFSDAATWWVMGSAPHVPYAGDMLAVQRIPEAAAMMTQFHAYSFTPSRIVADGGNVMLEARAKGTGATEDAPVYENTVVMAFDVLPDGRIAKLREYIDNYRVEVFRQDMVTFRGVA